VKAGRDEETAAFIANQQKRVEAMTADLNDEDAEDFEELLAADNARRGM